MNQSHRQPSDSKDASTAFSFPTAGHPEEGEKVSAGAPTQPDEAQLDEAIAQSFPASDPVSITVSPPPKGEAQGPGAEAPSVPAAPGAPAWAAAALLSTVVVGVGVAAWLLQGRRRPAARLARLLPAATALHPLGRALQAARALRPGRALPLPGKRGL